MLRATAVQLFRRERFLLNASGKVSAQTSRAASRATVLARWRGEPPPLHHDSSTNDSSAPQPIPSEDIAFSTRERLDYFLEYALPENWTVSERVFENFISIEASPPRPDLSDREATDNAAPEAKRAPPEASVHGLCITAFAYHRRVQEPNPERLLRSFVTRFEKCVQKCVVVSTVTQPSSTAERASHRSSAGSETPTAARAFMEKVVSNLGGSMCEITFDTITGIAAHGYCRTFYSTSRRHHYVVLVAVPEDEFPVSHLLVQRLVLGVTEQMKPDE